MTPPDEVDVVVVGSSLEGLLLATELERAGRRVVLLEQRQSLGGRYRVESESGFTFGTGIHLARYGAHGSLGEMLFRQEDAGSLRELGRSYVVMDGRIYVLPLGVRALFQTRLLGLREQARAVRMLFALRSWADPFGQTEKDLDGWMDVQGIGEGLARVLRLAAGSMTMRADPGALAAGEVLEALRRAVDLGVVMSYPSDGWGNVVRSAGQRFTEAGGRLMIGAAVRSVDVEEGAVVGVTEAGGRRWSAPEVVWAADPARLKGVVEELGPDTRRAMECVRPVRAVGLSLGLERPVSATTGLWYLDDPGAWVFFPSNLARSLAPPEGQLLEAVIPLAEGDASHELVARLEEQLGGVFSGLSSHVVARRTLVLERLHGTDVGSDATRIQRPPIALGTPRGLFLVGDTVAAPGLGPEVGFGAVRRALQRMLGSQAELEPPEVAQSSEAGEALKVGRRSRPSGD